MKRAEAMAVGDILKAMMEAEGDTGTYDRQKVCYLWAEVAGPVINRATTRRYMSGHDLHVEISSAALKSEMRFMIPSLVDHINWVMGKKMVKRIILH